MFKNVYKKLKERYDDLLKLDDDISMMESCSLMNLFGDGFCNYEFIAKWCLENNISKVYDIGCGYGHQSEFFIENKINYVGIESENLSSFWRENQLNYLKKSYPFKINTNKNDLAISVLCLTWNCYLTDGEKTLHKQLKQLSEDFNHCLLFIAKDKVDFVKCYYKEHINLGGNYHYFSK